MRSVRPVASATTMPLPKPDDRRAHVRGVREGVRAPARRRSGRAGAPAEGGLGRVTAVATPCAPTAVSRVAGCRRCMACHAAHGTAPRPASHDRCAREQAHPVRLPAGDREQRRALLAGLLDTDGTVARRVGSSSRSRNERLARRLLRAARRSASATATAARQARQGPHRGVVDRATRSTSAPTTRSSGSTRKRLVHKDAARGRSPGAGHRFITRGRAGRRACPCGACRSTTPTTSTSRRGSMIPTHNSTVGLDIARSASIKHGHASVIFSLEMSRNEITMRLLSAEAKVHAAPHAQRARCATTTGPSSRATMGEVSEAPLFIDDSPNMSMMEIRAKCRRLKQRHDLKLVVIDYLQLMSSRQAGREPPAGGLGVLPRAEAAGQGARGAGDRGLASSTVVRSSAPTSGRR